MTIKVLADSTKDKVHGLLQVTKRLLDELGYADFRLHGTPGGGELTLKARHRATQDPLLCRVKALPRDIGPDQIRGFLQVHARERRKDKRLTGLLLCFSDLSHAAQEWMQKNSEARRHVHLFEADKVLALLRRAKLIASTEAIKQTVRARVRDEVGPLALVQSDGRYYWLQVVLQGKRPVGFVTLEADGEAAPRWIAQEIKRLDPALAGKRFLDLLLRERVLLTLLDLQKRNTEDLAKETRATPADLRPVVQDLLREQVFTAEHGANPRWKFDRYSIRPELDNVLGLARMFLDGPHRFRFVGSPFVARALSGELPKHLERRLRLSPAEMGRLGVMGLVSVSPGAFNHALFAPMERYATLSTEGDPRSVPGAERDRAWQTALARLQSELILALLGDMQSPHFADLINTRGIKAYLFRATAKAATLTGTAYRLQAETLTPLGKPGAAGRPGGEANHFVDYGQALMHMEEHEAAVAQFDRGLRDLKDPLRVTAAWTSRGICLYHLKKHTDAVNSFNEALKHNGNHKEAWFHKALCLRELGDPTGALRCAKRALELDPAYTEAREFLQAH
jgi:hypothetical protein